MNANTGFEVLEAALARRRQRVEVAQVVLVGDREELGHVAGLVVRQHELLRVNLLEQRLQLVAALVGQVKVHEVRELVGEHPAPLARKDQLFLDLRRAQRWASRRR